MMSTEFDGILPIDYLSNSQLIKTKPVYQYDHGLFLLITGITNPEEVQGHFTTKSIHSAMNILPEAVDDGIQIAVPDVLLANEDDIFVYIYIENEVLGYTAKTIQIPIFPRPKPEKITLENPHFIIINQLKEELQNLIDAAAHLPMVEDPASTHYILETKDIDATLSHSGMAADAKATGDGITQLLESTANLTVVESVDAGFVEWQHKTIIGGVIFEDAARLMSNFVEVNGSYILGYNMADGFLTELHAYRSMDLKNDSLGYIPWSSGSGAWRLPEGTRYIMVLISNSTHSAIAVEDIAGCTFTLNSMLVNEILKLKEASEPMPHNVVRLDFETYTRPSQTRIDRARSRPILAKKGSVIRFKRGEHVGLWYAVYGYSTEQLANKSYNRANDVDYADSINPGKLYSETYEINSDVWLMIGLGYDSGAFSEELTEFDTIYVELPEKPYDATLLDVRYSADINRAWAGKKNYQGTTWNWNSDNEQFPTFVHVTDVHGDMAALDRAFEFAKAVKADAVIGTGDFVYYYSTDDFNFVKRVVGNHTVPWIEALGNHEMYQFTEAQAYTKYIAPFAEAQGYTLPDDVENPTYFYKDFTDRNLRVISVNMFQTDGKAGSSSDTRGCYHQAQMDFLCNALLATPEGYGVVIAMHSPEVKPVADAQYGTFFQPDIPSFNIGMTITPIREIVDAFIGGVAISKTYNNASGASPASFTVSADFSGKQAGVEFLAYMTGHLHADAISYVPGTIHKQLMLNATCTNSWNGLNANGTIGTGNDNLTELSDLCRERFTTTEDAINVYIIDRPKKRVKIARIGACLTYDYRERECMVIPYA